MHPRVALWAIPPTILTAGLFQVLLYWFVLRKDRNHITQMGLAVIGLIPFVGAIALTEQALKEAGLLVYPPGPTYIPPKPVPPVSTVEAYRKKVEESE